MTFRAFLKIFFFTRNDAEKLEPNLTTSNKKLKRIE